METRIYHLGRVVETRQAASLAHAFRDRPTWADRIETTGAAVYWCEPDAGSPDGQWRVYAPALGASLPCDWAPEGAPSGSP